MKRLHQEASAAYGSVQFDYNNQKSEKESKNDEEKSEEADEAFTPPQNLVIPPNIVTVRCCIIIGENLHILMHFIELNSQKP